MNEFIKVLRFKDLQSGWRGINEFLYLKCHAIDKRGGGTYSTEYVSYNNYVIMDRAWVDPEFNFGKTLGYAKAKWSGLVSNYVNMNYLDIIKNTINHRHGKDAKSYNYSFHFSNRHGHGKDCLMTLCFTLRVTQKRPVVLFTIRTSEVTKRLLFDFLLVQRIVEYVYGHNDVEVHLFAPSFYITAESFVMYNNVKRIEPLLKSYLKKNNLKIHKFQGKVLETFNEYLKHPDPHSIMYRVHRRSVLQIRKDRNGDPESGVKDMFARDLKLIPEQTLLPKKIISKKALKKYKSL